MLHASWRGTVSLTPAWAGRILPLEKPGQTDLPGRRSISSSRIGFVSTIYLWAYDQLPYIIPIVWIIGTLVTRTKSYLHAFIFLIVLDLFSFFALMQQAGTSKDLWSLGTTVIVLGMAILMWLRVQSTSTIAQDTPANA